jgi:hypothetical protein
VAGGDESGTDGAVGDGVTGLDEVTDFDGLGVVADDEGGSPAGVEGGADAGMTAFVLKSTRPTPTDFMAATAFWHAVEVIAGEQLIRPRTSSVPETGSPPAESRVFPG